MEQKVLVVDDEKGIVDGISYALRREGYIVEKAYDGKEAIEKFKIFNPKVIILDLMLPKLNGYDVCKEISGTSTGILMLTAKNDIVDKVIGLELGADDYLTKPFDIREVIARVKSLIRRFEKVENTIENTIIVGELVIDLAKRTVSIKENFIDFTAKEFDLIYKLMSNPGRVYSRDELLNDVWGFEYIGGTRTVDTHIQRIRKKLGKKYEKIIVTIHSVGYKGEFTYEEGN